MEVQSDLAEKRGGLLWSCGLKKKYTFQMVFHYSCIFNKKTPYIYIIFYIVGNV